MEGNTNFKKARTVTISDSRRQANIDCQKICLPVYVRLYLKSKALSTAVRTIFCVRAARICGPAHTAVSYAPSRTFGQKMRCGTYETAFYFSNLSVMSPRSVVAFRRIAPLPPEGILEEPVPVLMKKV